MQSVPRHTLALGCSFFAAGLTPLTLTMQPQFGHFLTSCVHILESMNNSRAWKLVRNAFRARWMLVSRKGEELRDEQGGRMVWEGSYTLIGSD
jgi:hypothetical protein